MTENTYTQQNYLNQLCMGCTSHLDRLEARYYRMQAEAWQHRARQLKGDKVASCFMANTLQNQLAKYAELEKKLNERRG